MSQFDKEYYVMDIDGANNHPLLTWGKVKFGPFLKANPVDETKFDIPLKIVFAEPYPLNYEMADLLMLDTHFLVSEKFKIVLDKLGIYGIQFVSADIEDNKEHIVEGNYVVHVWNRLPAIDKNNYEGEEPNMFGNIIDLRKFSLDEQLLKNIPLEKRLLFGLAENSTMYLIHHDIYDIIKAENLTGMKFFRVDDWDNNAMFRNGII